MIGPVAWIVRRTLWVSGPVGFMAVANAFASMLEGPMLIKPGLSRLEENGLCAVTTVCLSTVAGGGVFVNSSNPGVEERLSAGLRSPSSPAAFSDYRLC